MNKTVPVKLFYTITGFLILVYLFLGFRIYTVEGLSMSPALSPGSRVIVHRWSYGIPRFFRSGYYATWKKPERNDIITFYNPVEKTLSIKRCAGIPGDSLRLAHDVFFLNGQPLPPGRLPPAAPLENGLIPDSYLFFLGDNRPESLDSRFFGPVSMDYVVGKVVYWKKST